MFRAVRTLLRQPLGSSTRAVARRAPTFRPQVCGLEDRTVMDATVLYTGTFPLTSLDGDVSLSLTVTKDKPGYENLYYWDYKAVNTSYGYPDEYGGDGLQAFFALSGLNTSQIVEGWAEDDWAFEWAGSTASWYTTSNELIEQGPDATTFAFTTPVVPIVDGVGYYRDSTAIQGWDDTATGTIKGPGVGVVGTVGGRVVLDTGATPAYPPGTPPGPNTPVVVGANVRLLDGTSVVAETTSGADGSYLFPHVPEGSYSVEVTLPAAGAFSVSAGGQTISVGQDLQGIFPRHPTVP